MGNARRRPQLACFTGEEGDAVQEEWSARKVVSAPCNRARGPSQTIANPARTSIASSPPFPLAIAAHMRSRVGRRADWHHGVLLTYDLRAPHNTSADMWAEGLTLYPGV